MRLTLHYVGQLSSIEQSSILISDVGLTEDLIISQAVIFFLSGYDTTATMLAFLAYNLALNPDCQERLLREIDDIVKDNVSLPLQIYGLAHQNYHCKIALVVLSLMNMIFNVVNIVMFID